MSVHRRSNGGQVRSTLITGACGFVGRNLVRALLADGVQTNFKAQILTASVLCVLLAFLLDAGLLGVQTVLTPWARRSRR